MARAHSVSSQAEGDSDVVPACADRGRAQERNNGLCQHFCIGQSFPSSPHLEARQFSSSHISLVLFGFCPRAGAQSKQVHQQANLCVGPVKGTPGTSEALHITQPQSPLAFTARSYGDFSSWHWNPWHWSLVWG